MKKLGIVALMLAGGSATLSFAQSTGSVSQTVNQRNTIGVLTASPTSSLTTGETITFTYTLNTGGAPYPSGETVQFKDNGSSISSAKSITSANGSNLIPYSQVDTTNGWTTSGTAMTALTPGAVNGPDGSTNTATTLSFADSTSTVLYDVTSTSYASQQVTFSIWAKTATTATLNLTLEDGSLGNASSPSACSLTSAWQRCSVTYTFPGSPAAGFAAVLTATTYATNISVWGAQVEVAAAPGPYVSTIGTARASVTGGAGAVSWTDTTGFADGSHSITVVYGGNSNFVTSTSNAVSLTVGKATPGVSLVPSPSGPATYGVSVTLTATISNQDGGSPIYPTGTVTFYNGATVIGSGTLAQVGSGNTASYALVLSGTTSLIGGSDSLTVAYGGDSNFSATDDSGSPVSFTVNKATHSNGGATLTTSVVSTLNPSIYGDLVTLNVNVTGTGAMPTGTVTIVDTSTSTTLGTPTLDGSGNASVNVTASDFTAGSHSITVTYSGDGNYSSTY